MALTDGNGGDMVMPVGPMYGSGGSSFGGGLNDNGWWIILLFILLGNNGWGNGFGGFGGGGDLYPWMNQAEITTGGFRDQMINSNIDSIQNSVNGLSTQLCNCCADMAQTVNSGFANAETAANARQMANMQQIYGLSSQFADCCCENRLGTADLKYTIATENCADRAAISDGIRDVIASQTASTQRILDQLCSDKIDAKNEKIADLERQLTMANLAASQNLQTQQLLTDNLAQTNALEQYLAPVPRPAYIVQNPNCCTNTCGCGCGNGSF